jgi:diguanylate cyclase (GGDEF)-like protein
MVFSSFFRIKLINKLIISFLISALCMMSALAYSVLGLGAIHKRETDIAHNDLTAATVTITLGEVLIAQQRYVGRFQILGQSEFKDLYDQKVERFQNGLVTLRRVYPENRLVQLEKDYLTYSKLAGRVFQGEPVDPAELKRLYFQLERSISKIREDQIVSLEQKLKISGQKVSDTVSWSMGLAVGGVAVAFLISGLMIYFLASSIRKLQKATLRIAAGDFDYDPCIKSGDEIGALAQDFMRMAHRLKELEQLSLDASPLTRLPGNIAIERCINRRLRDKKSFTMCYLDLDNFKSYNDRYGYIRASDVIKETGQLIYNVVKQLDDTDTFVGHIGGDDFVVIISTEQAAMACQEIIKGVDAMMPTYYSAEDRQAGAIEGVDRHGVERIFPLISISIAALVCEPGDYGSAAEIATAAAAVKDSVKVSTGSNYKIVRRGFCEV